MDDCPNNIKEAMSYAHKLSLEAEIDMKKGDFIYAMHKYKAMAHTYYNAYKESPNEYKECLSLAVKGTLQKMDLVNSKTAGKPKKQKTLSDIIIGRRIKEDVTRFVGKMRRAPYSQVPGGDPTLLLYGPPGTGKSFLAEAIAQEYGTQCVTVQCGDINQKYRGQGEKMLTKIFEDAEKTNSCLFFDEIHLLFSFKDGEESSGDSGFVLQQFLTEMNNKSRGCLIIAASSRPWIMSETVRRRFEKHIYIPFPSLHLRKALLKYLISNCGMASALQPEHIEKYASKLDGYSPDDMNKVINCAAQYGEENLEKVEYFKKVSCSGKELFIPCKQSHSGAQKLSWKTCPGIVVSVLTVPLMDRAIVKTPSNKLSQSDKKKYDDYARVKM